MSDVRFTEDDIKQYAAALNHIALHAKFGDGPSDIKFIIECRNHFAFLQSMMSKMEAHILEVKSVKHKKDEDKKGKK